MEASLAEFKRICSFADRETPQDAHERTIGATFMIPSNAAKLLVRDSHAYFGTHEDASLVWCVSFTGNDTVVVRQIRDPSFCNFIARSAREWNKWVSASERKRAAGVTAAGVHQDAAATG